MARRVACLCVGLLCLACAQASGATYCVDYAGGDDDNPGTSAAKAFKHCPGDQQAQGAAAGVKLQPGDVVKFKGGVVYRGQIDVKQSGAKGSPIIYDGNVKGDYGAGRAVIDGSAPLTDLKQCRSAAEACGNPLFEHIHHGVLPKGTQWNTAALCQGDDVLPISQDPNPADPVFQENPGDYVKTGPGQPRTTAAIKVRFLAEVNEMPDRPLVSMFDGSRHSAVIYQINSGGEVEIELPRPVTAVEFSMTPQPRYVNPKEVSFLVGGREVLRAALKLNAERPVEQRFKLDAPVTFRKLVVKFLSAYPRADGKALDWGAVQQIAAYDKDGRNVLLTTRTSTLVNTGYFTQKDPNHWEGAYLALYARPAMVYYKRILGYEPGEHRVRFETLSHGEIPYERGGAFAMMNSVRIIDRPGEYAVDAAPQTDGTRKVYVWPLRLTHGKPEGLSYARHGVGFSIAGASYVTIQGFGVRKQGGPGGSTGITANGPATDLVVRDVKVTGLRGRSAGIHTYEVDNVLIDGCEVSNNHGHTKGILLRNGKNVITRNCLLRKNTSTALDYYTIHNGVVRNCTVIDNRGMHANGLTFYVGCTDILVEDNHVARGNAGLTVQDGRNMIIRNNVLSGTRAVALWAGKPYDNIVITNNCLFDEGPADGSSAAIYGGNPGAKGYTIANNIADGLSGNVLLKAEVHHNIFTRMGPVQTKANLGDNKYVPDLARLFVDPDKGDYRLKLGSPAVDAGVAITSINSRDRAGLRRPIGERIDIGPYEFVPPGQTAEAKPAQADPYTFEFTFGGYRIQPPAAAPEGYESVFEQLAGGQSYSVRAMDFTAEQGGKVKAKKQLGWIYMWNDKGHWLEWTIPDAKEGLYELVIQYGSETPSRRQYVLNGEPIKGAEQVALNATGGWSIWQKAALKTALHLKAGRNVLRVVNVQGPLNFRTLRFVQIASDKPTKPHLVTDAE